MRDDGIPIRTRPSAGLSKQAMTYLAVAGGGVLLLAMVAITITFVVLKRNSSKMGGDSAVNLPAFLGGEPTAEREGTSWTIEDLAGHLKGKGVITQWEVIPKMTTVLAQYPAVKVKLPNGEIDNIIKMDGVLSAEEAMDYRSHPVYVNDHPPETQDWRWGCFVVKGGSRKNAHAILGQLKGAEPAKPR